MALVPLPPPPPEPEPVVKTPPVGSPNCSPAGFSPEAVQTICRFAGNAGVGVQVRMVLPPLQTCAAGRVAKVVMSMKSTPLSSGFIAWLKVKTNGPDGEAPLAGGGEVMVGSAAWSDCRQSSETAKARGKAKRLCRKNLMGWIQLPPAVVVTEKMNGKKGRSIVKSLNRSDWFRKNLAALPCGARVDASAQLPLRLA